MINAIVVSGGNIQKDFALDFLGKELRPEKKPLLIAADRGVEFFAGSGLVPDLVVGDFDSLSEKGREFLKSLKNTEIKKLRPEKDDSDTQSAVKLAIDRGAKEILILGATGTRVDHLLANLGLLLLGKKRGAHIIMADANNYITIVDSGTVLRREEQFGKYVSFFSIGGDVEELTLLGFKYNLLGHHLKASDSGLTVSNEIVQATAEVSYKKGTLIMIMSRD